MMSVWATNASVGKESGEFDDVPFHQTRVTAEFLDYKGSKFFVCGLKGIGKTLLLKKKSQHLRHSQDGVVFLPANELVEKLNPFVYSMSATDLADLSGATGWARIWQMALAIAIAKRLRARGDIESDLPAEVREVFPQADASVSYHMDKLLAIGPNRRRLLIEDHLAHVLSLLREIQSGVNVFVDSIDECVYTHAGPDFERYRAGVKSQLGILSPDIWRAAQVGFVRAAVGLHEMQRHVKIFGAFRKEAIDAEPIPDRQNFEAYLLVLEYSRQDLRGIFTTKLEALRKLSPEAFSDPSSNNIVGAFFGFRTLAHPSVTSITLDPLNEPVLDYIIRHSRGRPRELDMIGESLQLIPAPRDPEEVRRRVRDKSRAWFDWAKSEMIPMWPDAYGRLLSQLPSNILPKEQCERILVEMEDPDLTPEAFVHLFELGLLGCPVRGEDGGETQKFRQNDPDLPVSAQEFQAASHFIVHPCVNLATRSLKDHYRADSHNVAGHGYSFVRVPRALHVHFGAGALGIGLVLPLLTANRSNGVCLIQRVGTSTRWEQARAWKDPCDLSYRYRPDHHAVATVASAFSATVITDADTHEKITTELERWADGRGNVFILSDDRELWARALSQATSVSTALRVPESMIDVASLVVAHGHSVKAVYPFENDEETLAVMSKKLAGQNAALVQVSADRICVHPLTTGVGITVDTEDYFRVVINDESSYSKTLFGGVPRDDRHQIVFEGDPRRFRLLHEAKRYLVNGLHFAYVLYAFRMLKNRFPDKVELVRLLITNPVSELLGFSQEVQDSLDRIANLYCLHLVSLAEELGVATNAGELENWHQELRTMYDTFVDRLTSTRDQLDRILKPEFETVVARIERFAEPMRELGPRVAKLPVSRRFFEEARWESNRIQNEANAYTADCTSLLRYVTVDGVGVPAGASKGKHRPQKASKPQRGKGRSK